MRRRLFNVVVGAAAAVSLVLSLATLMIWAASYWYVYGVTVEASPWWYGVITRDGSCAIFRSHREYPHGIHWIVHRLGPSPMPSPMPGSGMLGFRWLKSYSGTSFGFPLWLPALMLALPALPALYGWRKRSRRADRGLCAVCGYDLRASPDRCPECGAEAKPQPAEGAPA